MKKPVWKKIADNVVQHIWKKADDDDCGEGPETVVVSPDWYEENGTPICFCGQDMVYSHTEILLPDAEEKIIVMRCAKCKSTDVRRDADVVWDKQRQEWVLNGIFDSTVCETCGSTRIEEIEE